MPFFLLILLCVTSFAQIQGETPALTPFANELGTHLIAMPTYTYSRMPGALGLEAEEEIWRPDKWRNRRIFGRFVPIMDWEAKQNSIWFYTGNEIGDELWRELSTASKEPNATPMLYGGVATPPFGGFYAVAQFNQIDHFSEATFETRKKRLSSQKFSWFGENLPAYSGVYGGFGYNSTGDFFKNASILTGSEYLWAWNKEEWVPIRISPRTEANAGFYFMEKEIELYAATEKFQIQDSAAENRKNFGMRVKGENTGAGMYANQIEDNEYIMVWLDFNHNFLQHFTNKGVIEFYPQKSGATDTLELAITDSLEYKIDISETTDLIIGILLGMNGVKLYGETSYEFKPLSMKLRAYRNYAFDFQSVGFDGEVAYKSRIAEAGAAYSKEFFDYLREQIYYEVKPAENSAKLFFKYRFLENLTLAHEWVYRDNPATWFWNAQAEQRIPKLNASLYAVWLNALSRNNKDFSFGGVNKARFYCGATLSF